MGESGLEASYSRNSTKYFESSDRSNTENSSSINRIKRLVYSLNHNDNQDGLVTYSRAFQVYSSDFRNLECLERFVDGLITKARQSLSRNIFNLNYFLCVFCGDILSDPVTLKCGHSFSKKCVLSEAYSGSFDCLKCRKTYSHSYLSELQTNVVMSTIIEKFWAYSEESSVKSENEDNRPDQSTTDENNANNEESFQNFDACCSFIESPSLKECLREGNLLVNSEKYLEAIQLLLICSVFHPSDNKAKDKAIELFYKHLLKDPKYMKKCDCSSVTKDLENIFDPLKVISCEHLNKPKENQDLVLLMRKLCEDITKLSGEKFVINRIGASLIDKQDFECPLCMRFLWEPITTPCGHTFCRVCLYRCFDHQPTCPLCKTSLTTCLAERVQSTNEMIELVMANVFSTEYFQRKALFIEEMEELANAGKDPNHEIPLFVCTTSFPTVPCPLHIFEPRYRLMIRQCMESGNRKFGMCAYIDNNIAEYGTILEIKDVRYFPDGRSVVDTVGSKRFRILSKGERDGYNTGSVEYIKDDVLSGFFIQDLKQLHDHLYKISQGWFMRLPQDTKHQILQHFGPMPRMESNYLTNPDGPSWFWWMLAILPIEPKSQVLILSMTCLARRLKTLEKILLHLDSSIVS
ncbi:LON peptidase N-terminal domain and RING finger protein 3 [Parasteatoda tepidariorum]|uniref:LON peptidase N-terminal domain and RING finger protein 3 n=1 Tax=Parasteatoda tepidariorum TaxID=114398 RepID=UPI00077FDCC6|nr:LON peptidase N-terminal domain and RING finger protein 3 [Parasteatoda tepidariorum]